MAAILPAFERGTAIRAGYFADVFGFTRRNGTSDNFGIEKLFARTMESKMEYCGRKIRSFYLKQNDMEDIGYRNRGLILYESMGMWQ